MAASKTVNPVNPSPTVSPQRAYLFEAHFAGFVFRLFQTPEVGLMDTLRYKLVSQGTLQVTEVDNA